MTTTISTHDTDVESGLTSNPAEQKLLRLAPWLAGSGIALGQALLATACTLPTVGKCAGCGSCVVGVATLSTWALKRRKADAALAKAQGLEPFEIRTVLKQNG